MGISAKITAKTSAAAAMGIDLVAGGRSKKAKRTSPRSDDVYLKFLVKLHKFLTHISTQMRRHGAPEDEIRHAGDLGNIIANSEGVAEATIVDSQIPLSGPNAVVGRALVVHELEDDLGKGGHKLSLTTGNAGGRLACAHLISLIRCSADASDSRRHGRPFHPR